MALTVTLLGTAYSIPEPGDVGYDQGLTNYLKALATAFPQVNGGTYALTAELDLGASFGVKQLYVKSETATPATAGVVRLAKTDAVDWRNNANSANLALAIDTADALTFGGANVTGNPMLSASTAAAQSIPNTAVTIVVFGTVERDSDAAYNSTTGRFTVPVGKGGDYRIDACDAFTAAAGTTPSISIAKNATLIKTAQVNSAGAGQALSIGGTFNFAAGDVIDIRVFQNSGGAVTLINVATQNFFSIKRIPT